MGRTSCPGCGATVDVVKDVSTGRMVALDTNLTLADPGVRQYVYMTTEPMVTRVKNTLTSQYYFRAHECIEPPNAA